MTIQHFPGSGWGKLSYLAGLFVVWLILAAFLSAAVIVAWQTYFWLRYGAWPSLEVIDGLHYFGLRTPQVTWIGFQTLIEYGVSQTLAFGIFIAFLIASLVSFCVMSVAAQEERVRAEVWRKDQWKRDHILRRPLC